MTLQLASAPADCEERNTRRLCAYLSALAVVAASFAKTGEIGEGARTLAAVLLVWAVLP